MLNPIDGWHVSVTGTFRLWCPVGCLSTKSEVSLGVKNGGSLQGLVASFFNLSVSLKRIMVYTGRTESILAIPCQFSFARPVSFSWSFLVRGSDAHISSGCFEDNWSLRQHRDQQSRQTIHRNNFSSPSSKCFVAIRKTK